MNVLIPKDEDFEEALTKLMSLSTIKPKIKLVIEDEIMTTYCIIYCTYRSEGQTD